jgi:hypothetical protein
MYYLLRFILFSNYNETFIHRNLMNRVEDLNFLKSTKYISTYAPKTLQYALKICSYIFFKAIYLKNI